MVGLLALLFSGAIWAGDLTIEITQGLGDPAGLAVVPFQWQGSGRPSDDVANIVSNNFSRTGQFKVTARRNMLSQPSSMEEVYYQEWASLGVDHLVIGKLRNEGGRYVADYELYNVVTRQRVSTGTASAKAVRDVAHFVADLVYEKITGQPGAFSTKLLYVTLKDRESKTPRYELKLSDSDGFRDVTLLKSAEPILSPTWSPDGKYVAYVSFESGNSAIYLQNRFTGKRERVTNFKRINGAPAFSPDGSQLAMALSKNGNLDIYTLTLADRKLRRVTRHYMADTEPAWFPDGKHLLFTSDRAGSPQIYKVALSTGELSRLTFHGKYNARGQLTADGRQLVLVNQMEGGWFNIGVQDMERGNMRILSSTRLDESPSIAPNGSMVIYATKVRGRSVLSLASVDGNVKAILPTTKGEVRDPAWSPYLVGRHAQ